MKDYQEFAAKAAASAATLSEVIPNALRGFSQTSWGSAPGNDEVIAAIAMALRMGWWSVDGDRRQSPASRPLLPRSNLAPTAG